MKASKSRPDSPQPKRDDADRKQAGRSSAATGGAPATEEDIGTEGAGSEPRIMPAQRKPGPSSKSSRRAKG